MALSQTQQTNLQSQLQQNHGGPSSNSGFEPNATSKLSHSRISNTNKRSKNNNSSSNLQGGGTHDLAATGFLPLREEDEPLNEQQFQ